MAQSTQGTKVGWAAAGLEGAKPSEYKYFPDITGFPNLSGSVNTLDTTTLSETVNKTYISGLRDYGGVQEFPAILTTELYDEVEKAIAGKGANGYVYICIEFPAPFSKRAYFKADILPVVPDDGSVDSVLTTSVQVVPKSDIQWEAVGK